MYPIQRLLPKKWQNYAIWLANQPCPPKSYREHPFNTEEELKECQKAFQQAVGISLGKYIRLQRVNYILTQSDTDYLNQLSVSEITTPLGKMIAIFSDNGLCLLEFADRKALETELLLLQKTVKANFICTKTDRGEQLQSEIDSYFQGNLTAFKTNLDLIGTPFQQQVWEGLLTIPYGQTRSYKQQSELLGKPKAIRAVAAANGHNKISILIPCHRVIGSDGSLVGYGGGIERKKALLQLENAL